MHTRLLTRPRPRVAIVGGGLAGLAAAAALVERGCHVELFEARRKLGGRAGSFVDRVSGEAVDHCQHVAMGCCTNFLDFCRRTGIDDLFAREGTLHFFGPDGRRSDFRPSRWLPPPLHLAAAFWNLNFLSPADKLGLARAMLRLIRMPPRDAQGTTVLSWLHHERQSPRAIERLWQVVLVSALGESLDRASLAAARKVFLDGFLAHREASHLYVPRVSLSELYDQRVANWLRSRGATIHLESAVAKVSGTSEAASGLQFADGTEKAFDFVILAVPWRRVGELLSAELRAAVDLDDRFAQIGSAPITGVHFWFDRAITELPHAVLVGRLSQWLFARPHARAHPLPLGEGGSRSEPGEGRNEVSTTLTPALSQREREEGSAVGLTEHYYQVVISASHDLAGRDRQSVVDEVLADLRAVFPPAAAARLCRWQLVTEHEAVFSVRPGLEAIRPSQQTVIPNLLLAGDWTSTGWPATMESAVRSGYLAAEAVLARLGRPEPIVVPDLPRGWLVKGLGARG